MATGDLYFENRNVRYYVAHERQATLQDRFGLAATHIRAYQLAKDSELTTSKRWRFTTLIVRNVLSSLFMPNKTAYWRTNMPVDITPNGTAICTGCYETLNRPSHHNCTYLQNRQHVNPLATR